MKKTISIALAAMLCVSGVFATQEERPAIVLQMDKIELGIERIAHIRKEYIKGRYNNILKALDHSYEEAVDNEYVLGLGAMRRGAMNLKSWLDGVKNIKEETHRELIQAVYGQETPFAEKVRNITTSDGLENLLVVYHQMQPNTGKNEDENALIALDLEYEYKAIHLDQISTEISNDLNTKDLHYVLKMEQMDKILLAAQSFEDATLRSAIEQFAQNLDARLARHWDLMDLRKLASEKLTDQIEIRVAAILKAHQEKIQELARSYLLESQ